jgi:hypothetical protein
VIPSPWRGIAVVPVTADLDETGVVGSYAVPDVELAATDRPVRITTTGGAGQLAGPVRRAARLGLDLRAVDLTLRDLDDLAGNARRVVAAVDAARSEGVLAEEVEVYVELPDSAHEAGWLAAADELAAVELRLAFPVAPSATTARWIDAALDRETPFRFAGDLPGAAFVHTLAATRAAYDGASVDAVVEVLEGLEPQLPEEDQLAGARRWFTSYAATSAAEPLETLRGLGLLE